MQFRTYLSFGFICELSFALKMHGVFEPGYLSWADVRGTNALVNAIRNPQSLLSGEVHRYSGNMFFCKKTQIGFHGKTQFSDCLTDNGTIDEEKISSALNETKDRIAHLIRKTDEIISAGEALIIVKWVSDAFDERYSPYESGIRVLAELKNRYSSNFHLLYVFEKSSGHLEWTEQGFYGRRIEAFAPRSSASKINREHWAEVLTEFL